MRNYIKLLILIIAAATSFECSKSDKVIQNEKQVNSTTIQVIDDLGRVVSLNNFPKRIVSLVPSITEILFALGLDDNIVGVTIYCNYPEEALDKLKIGDFSNPSLERIIASNPDLIFATSFEQSGKVAQLEDFGIPIYVCYPENVDRLFKSILAIGEITGNRKEAEKLTESMRLKLIEIEEKVRVIPANERPKVFLEIASGPLMTVGNTSFVADLVRLAGGINIGYNLPRDYSIINQEVVIERNPDVIFLLHSLDTKQNLKERIGWESILAIQKDKIYDDFKKDLIFRPGPRSIDGVQQMYKYLYPLN